MLGPVSSHTAAETREVVASLGNQPTVAGHSGDRPPDLETLRATPARPHQIVIQGNLARERQRQLSKIAEAHDFGTCVNPRLSPCGAHWSERRRGLLGPPDWVERGLTQP